MKENRRVYDGKHKVGVHKLQKTPVCSVQLSLTEQVLCVRTSFILFVRRWKEDQQEHRKCVTHSKQ